MKCPRCGSEMKDGMLFCEKCGEEIRIVQDFEPEVDGIMTGLGEDTFAEEPPDKPETARKKKPLSSGKKKLIGAGVLLIMLLIVLSTALWRRYDGEYQYGQARRYLSERNYAKAYPYAERAVSIEPENLEYLSAYAACLAANGQEEETIDVCLRMIELDADNQAAYDSLIAIYADRKAYQEINDLLLSCPDERIVNQYPSYVAKPPEFSVKSGIYNETISLRLRANTKGTIYYTLDGSQPDENSAIYTSPIFLETGGYRVRAVFVNAYGVASQEQEENYYVDVTVPDAPKVSPEEGSYSRPTLITVEAGEDCTVYYTTDGTLPTKDSTQYTGPFPMPVGVTNFRFCSYSAAGVASEEVQATYSLNLHAALTIEAARNKLLIELMAADVIQDMDGNLQTRAGHNVYNYRCAVTINGTDFYLYREYYEDDAGNRAGTGTDYVVDIMEGQCYKAVRVKEDAAAQETAQDPWSTLTLQNINSGEKTE